MSLYKQKLTTINPYLTKFPLKTHKNKSYRERERELACEIDEEDKVRGGRDRK